MDIIESKGYEKLKDAVERDIKHQLEMALNHNESFNCHFNKGFRCPNCKGISNHPQICDSNKVVNKKVCDWKSFGLFKFDLVTVVVKKPFSVTEIFKPINWEK